MMINAIKIAIVKLIIMQNKNQLIHVLIFDEVFLQKLLHRLNIIHSL